MIENPVGTKCILLDPCGRETVCRVTSASMRETIGCVPEIDLTVQIDNMPVVNSVPPGVAPKIVFRYGTKYKAKQVIFNPPATVVLWTDGTKTVVKCDPEDTFDETTGVALCYMKKALGNTSRELNKALRKARG